MVKPPLRAKTLSTKVSKEELAQLEAAEICTAASAADATDPTAACLASLRKITAKAMLWVRRRRPRIEQLAVRDLARFAAVNGPRVLLTSWARGCRRCDRLRKSFRRIGNLDKFSEHLR